MDNYDIIKHLGSGSYGEAFLAMDKIKTTKCVLKEIKIGHLNSNDLIGASQEVKVLASLVHNHITRFHDSFYVDSSLIIVMEYCAGGDLKSLINNRNDIHFPEERILDWFCQLCLAIKYIHDRHIIHRDIKPQNVLLTEDGKVKLGDFGIAKTLDKTSDLANTCIGTPYYLSPEMCENKPYSMKSDIWSLGCVLYELTALKHAFNAKNMKMLVTKIVKCSYQAVPNNYSRDMKLLISSIFQRDYKQRPSINIILRKPLIIKRISRFVSEEDCEQLKANILNTKGKKPRINMTKRVNIGKRIGISTPIAKYGNPSKLLTPKSKYGNVNHSGTSSIKTPKSSSIFMQKSANRARCQRKDLNNLKCNLLPEDKLFPVHYSRNNGIQASAKNRRMYSPKFTLDRNKKQRSVSENTIYKEKLKMPITNEMYLNSGEAKLTVSQSLISNVNDRKMSGDNTPIFLQQLERFSNSKNYSTPINNLYSSKRRCRHDFRSSALRKKISTLASIEVKKVSIAAQQVRKNSNSCQNNLCSDVQNNERGGEILSPEDINISVSSISRAASRRDSVEDILQSDNFIEPFPVCNDISSTPICRSKWNPAATPVYSRYPLELTDSSLNVHKTSVFHKRKQWSKSNNEILSILSSASLSDGHIDTSIKFVNKNLPAEFNSTSDRLIKSKSLPCALNDLLKSTKVSDVDHCKNDIKLIYNNTIQVHELRCINNAHKFLTDNIEQQTERIRFNPSVLVGRQRSCNNDIRIKENFVDNSPNFNEKTKSRKSVTFDPKRSPDKRNCKPKKRLFSFLYKKTPPKSNLQRDTEPIDGFFKKSRISSLLKKFKRGDKCSRSNRSEVKADVPFNQCLHGGEVFSTDMSSDSENVFQAVNRSGEKYEHFNNSNVDSGIDVASQQTNISEHAVKQTSPCSRYCIDLNNFDSKSKQGNYSTPENDFLAINDKERLRESACSFVEGVFQRAIMNLQQKQKVLTNDDCDVTESQHVTQFKSDSELNVNIFNDATKVDENRELHSKENIYYVDKDGFLKDVDTGGMNTIYEQNQVTFVNKCKPRISLSYEDLSINNLYCHELTNFHYDNDAEINKTYCIEINTPSGALLPCQPHTDNIFMNKKSRAASVPRSLSEQVKDSKQFWQSLEDLLNLHEDNQIVPNHVNVAELGFVQGMEDIFGWIEEKKALLEAKLGLDEFLESYKIMERAFEEESNVMGQTVAEVKNKLGSSIGHVANEILELLIAESVYNQN